MALRPAELSNNPALIDRFGFVGVNSALEVDLFEQVNSTHVNGNHAMNGIGGSGDYNRNAAIAVLALPSTAASGDLSRVVPMVPHVDHTEHDINIIVTEQDVADPAGTHPAKPPNHSLRTAPIPTSGTAFASISIAAAVFPTNLKPHLSGISIGKNTRRRPPVTRVGCSISPRCLAVRTPKRPYSSDLMPLPTHRGGGRQ
ncbi:MAG: acetyl-CoA hydrolase/transferase C-terminal domain-containing protein [Natronomonas sp.]|uniref:acetyl-CoA hydrolase/transferase C-terminal domain-containing protein n=1 Tax=Natronomonas sp. TaxID=2184060 RepID=UPI0028700073|nr:acetyl-CoA hydrolase/transferase C-terminal domain-containing protein [Natronomonas sp.]MDR9431040.1 acetyl-CoA hydrolase/transferase C-terminal domain-containing protein [Natronomonas sp.]